MYIKNIISAITDLADNEVLLVNYRSGKQSKVLPSDKYHNQNGDLIITRHLKLSRCVVYIDCAEVESLIIHKGDDL